VIGYPPIAEDADVSDGRLQYVSGESHLRGRKPTPPDVGDQVQLRRMRRNRVVASILSPEEF